MPTTPVLGLNRPLGLLRCTHNATSSTTAQFHTTNADATDIAIGDKVRCYNVAGTVYTFIGETIITNKQIDTPGAGVTRFTVAPVFSSAPVTGAELYKVDIVDPSVFMNPQMDKIDMSMDATLCTPGTRPGVPYVGQLIVESAVIGVSPFEVRYWNGSTWVLMVQSGAGVPGRVAFVTSNSAGPDTGQNQENGPYLSATISVISGHTYLIHVCAAVEEFVTNLSAEALCRVRSAVGAVVTTSSTKISDGGFDPDTGATQIPNNWTFHYTAVADEQRTFGVFLYVGSCDVFDNVNFAPNAFNILAIEDAGEL